MVTRRFLLLACLFLSACTNLPPSVDRNASVSLPAEHSRLAGVARERVGSAGGDSAAALLDTGREAFETRIALADAAEVSLDAQYFIWNADTTGRLLADRLLRAAERGVRVRLLVDDVGVGHKDNALYSLDTHSNIEVRVYNPVAAGYRSGPGRLLGFAAGMQRLLRRMHSKSFVVDGSVAIVGGRNIGDEYFDARRETNHRDRELFVLGPVVATVNRQFDEMWNSPWAIPIAGLVSSPVPRDQLDRQYRELRAFAEDAGNWPYPLPVTAARRDALVDSLVQTTLLAPMEFVYNPPRITGGESPETMVIADRLTALLEASEREVLVESAYFIVSDALLERVRPLLGRGVDIRVLTNSLAATDVWAIHAGYSRNRKDVIRQGIGLHELRPDAASCQALIRSGRADCSDFKMSLHAKSIVFDRKTVYVGSFNINPRSRSLNTETALIVHSEELAARIARDIEENMRPQNSWRVSLDDTGQLQWRGLRAGREVVYRHEPDVGAWKRLRTFLFSFLPVEQYL